MYINPETINDPDLCQLCGGAGYIEIIGGSDFDEVCVVDTKPCSCVLEANDEIKRDE